MTDIVVEERQYVTLIDGFVPVPGPPGGVTIKGELADVADLPASGNAVNDGWLIDGDLWVWTEAGVWLDAGNIQGPPGPAGADSTVPGPAGTIGPQGVQGVQGAPGTVGATGATGATGGQGNPGVSTTIVGEVATVGALPPVASVDVGDSYIVTADGNLYTSTGTAWLDVGQIVGPQGPTGSTGATGATGGQGIQGVQGIQGIQGVAGATGAQGDPGEPGGSLLTAFWSYATNTAAPPSNGQVRSDSPITTLWVAEVDTDGMNRAAGLATAEAGDTIIVRAANGTSMDLLITGTPVDSGTYWSIPVSVIIGTVTKGARTMLGILSPTPHGIPAGGTTNQVLGKTSGADYAVSWRDDQVGGGGGGITSEDAVDAVAAALTAGNNIDIAYNDTAGTITVDVETLTSADVGLSNVDNTSDATKPVFTATVRGLVPPPTTVTGKILKDDGTWTTTAPSHGASHKTGGGDPVDVTVAQVEGLQTVLDAKQSLDSDLTTIAALAATTNNVIQSVASSWASRTPAQLKSTLALVKADVGLDQVDNTSNATERAATATLTNKTLTAPIITLAINAQTGTTYTLVLGDASKLVTLTNAAAVALTVPANSTVAYPVGTTIDVAQLGAGQVTVAGAGGVTVVATPGLKLRAQYAAATLIKTATDSWLAVGDLAA